MRFLIFICLQVTVPSVPASESVVFEVRLLTCESGCDGCEGQQFCKLPPENKLPLCETAFVHAFAQVWNEQTLTSDKLIGMTTPSPVRTYENPAVAGTPTYVSLNFTCCAVVECQRFQMRAYLISLFIARYYFNRFACFRRVTLLLLWLPQCFAAVVP